MGKTAFVRATAAALALLGTACEQEPEQPSAPDRIDAADYFPLEAGAMWQFQVEGGGEDLGYTFLIVGEKEQVPGGLSVWPVTVATGADERSAEVEAIWLLQSEGGWVSLAGYRDPADGTDAIFDTPAALGRSGWEIGEPVKTTVTPPDGEPLTLTATLEEIADRSVYYGTFFSAARVSIDAGEGAECPLAGTWWWAEGVGPIHFTPSAEGSFAIELVYYE